MTDDIVTRLRQFSCQELNCSSDEICDEAADEIERLRDWKELSYYLRNKYWWVMRAKTLKKFDAMHKADWARYRD